MRGKAVEFRGCDNLVGITPAYAGKSLGFGLFPNLCKDHPRLCGEKQMMIRCTRSFRDHPRLCGEKYFWRRLSDIRTGSPPPMRGKGKNFGKSLTFGRITPAYAGKSCVLRAVVVRQQDHPRLCGEKVLNDYFGIKSVGSPPPMRGKVVFGYYVSKIRRITPAYAGKRKNGCSGEPRNKDHPRLCGEKGDPSKPCSQ